MYEESNVYHEKEYKCDKCKKELTIFELGFLGSTSDYKLIKEDGLEKVENAEFIGDIQCSPHTDMTCICKECY